MATITRLNGIPNVLLVTGADVADVTGVAGGDYRSKLKNILYAASRDASPVRRGTHDFWITYYQPTLGAASEAGNGYADNGASPNRLSSIVYIQNPNTAVAGQVETILQEIGHRWLVPSDFAIGGVRPMTAAEFTNVVNDGQRTDRPLLLGRNENHWSTFFNADASPLDGMGWVQGGTDDGLTRWDQRAVTVSPISRTGLTPLNLGQTYNDLDLFLMGVKGADEAYSLNRGRFSWIEPRVVTPLQYHIGLFVAFSQTDFIYFGFYGDPRTLAAQRTGRELIPTNVGLDYRPFSEIFGAMMLRVVRRGNLYHLQARNGNSALGAWQALAAVFTGVLPTTNAPTMFDQLDLLPEPTTTGSWNDFRTVTTYDVPERPLAVGVFTKTWVPILAEGGFFTFEIRDSVGDRNLPTLRAARPLVPRASFSDLALDTLYRDQPQAGTWMRVLREHAMAMAIGTPYTGIYDHWGSVDRAPKIVSKAPTGDFVFGTSAKVVRALYSPWAAGAAAGSSIWGTERSASIQEVTISDAIRSQQLSWPSTQRSAFIIAAPNRSQIPDSVVRTINQVRQYWEETFRVATNDRVHFDTRL